LDLFYEFKIVLENYNI